MTRDEVESFARAGKTCRNQKTTRRIRMVTPDYYLPAPVACERLAAICARAGGTWTMTADAAPVEVTYAVPVHATDEVRAYLRQSARVIVEGNGIARFAGGRVFGPGNVLSPDGRAIARDVSLDFGKAPGEHWLLTYKKIRRPKPLAGSVAVVATPLGAGYAHWLMEELPRLLALGSDAGGAGKIMAHVAQPFAREAWARAMHGWQGEVIEPARLAHYACEELVVPSVPGPEGRPTPEMVQRVTKFAAAWGEAGASPRGERIYVSREGARRRRVSNEAELWAQLERRGFGKVRLEELTWVEQIEAFRGAKVIVAPHGAGLANLAFCRAGTTVVEFFNRSYVNGLFWQLAALKELDYRPVVAEGAEPLAQLAARGRDDIVAEVALVMRAVD